MKNSKIQIKGLKKPFDEWLHYAMIAVTADLMKKFPSVSIAYTESDEITLMYLPSFDQKDPTVPKEYSFANQIQKIISLMSATATNCFTNLLTKLVFASTGLLNPDECPIPVEKFQFSSYDPETQSKLKFPDVCFDARIFSVPTPEEGMCNLLWRAKDCIRNSISNAAFALFPNHSDTMNKNSATKLEMINSKLPSGTDYESYFSASYKYGTFLKYRLKMLPVPEEYRKEGGPTEATRSHIFAFSGKFFTATDSPKILDLLLAKALPEKLDEDFEKMIHQKTQFPFK